MATRTVIDQKALRAHFRTAEPQAALDGAAKAILAEVEDQSPVNTGYFQDHFRSRRFPLSRRIASADPWGHLVEWGGPNNIIYAPFRRSARALGFMLDEAPKP